MIVKSYTQNLEIELIKQIQRIGKRQFGLYRVRNLDALVDQVDDGMFAEDERLPYWAELWPSAIALSQYIYTHPLQILGNSVLELGCGLGLASMAIACQQPERFLVSDYEQDALMLTAMNFELNRMPPPQSKLVDWRRPALNENFDVIIAADVLYEKRFFTPLIELVKTYLKPAGTLILAEPGRPVAGKFFSELKNNAFVFRKETITVYQNGTEIRVRIYRAQRFS